MSFLGLASSLTLLAYGVALLVGSSLALPFLKPALRLSDPAVRARRLLALRLLPAGLACVVAVGVILPAFVWNEPRATNERVGLGLLFAAAISSAFLIAGFVRWAGGTLATRTLVRTWRRTGEPILMEGVTVPAFAIDDSFPIVALAGCVRPTLFISRIVLERCTQDELAAILAHETGHLGRRDPWSRVLLRACPDVLACTPLGAEIEAAWEESAEYAADDRAAAAGASRSLELASALLTVARLAGERSHGRLPLLALYRGGGVTGRVNRLLEPHALEAPRARGRLGAVAGIALAANVVLVAIAAGPHLLDGIHRLLESVVLLFR